MGTLFAKAKVNTQDIMGRTLGTTTRLMYVTDSLIPAPPHSVAGCRRKAVFLRLFRSVAGGIQLLIINSKEPVQKHMLQKLLPEPVDSMTVQKAGSFESLRKIFTEQSLTDSPVEVLALVALAVFAVAALTTWLQIRKRKKVHLHLGWITLPSQIQQILTIALKQRSTCELQFTPDPGNNRPVLRCVPDDVTESAMLLEAHGLRNIASKWQDRQVHCYFKISLRDQSVFYAFTSTVLDVIDKGQDRTILVLKMPERMENRQKRAFLRISPPEKYLLGAAIWYGNEQQVFHSEPEITQEDILFRLNPELEAGLTDEQLKERAAKREARKLPSPNLLYLKGRKEQFHVNNISASGARISLPKKVMAETETEFAVSSELVLLLDLLDPEKKQQLRFWMFCRVQNISIDHATGDVSMGLQFTTWTLQDDQATYRPEWIKTYPGQEVAPLGNWIVKRHLEMFRDNADGVSPF